MSALCDMAAPFVANSAVDGAPVARPFRPHVAGCGRCQDRHQVMVRTAAALRAMEGDRFPAPAELEWRVMSSLEGELAITRSWKKPVALGAAVVSMAAAVIIWRLRPRTTS